MSTQDNIKTAQQLYAAFDRGDIDAIINVLAEDVEWGWETVATEVPWLGIVKGRAAVRGFFDVIAKELDIHLFQRKEFIGSGNLVAVTYQFESTVKKTGKKVAEEGMHRWTFNQGGKVTAYRGFSDTAAHLAAWRG